MKRKIWLLSYLPFTIALISNFNTLSAQTRSAKAVEWYNQGLAEKDQPKKIEAYLNAIEEDHDFVEALHNLGVVYRKQRNLEKANEYLSKALEVESLASDNRLMASILQELAMVHQGLGDVEAGEKVLRQAAQLSINNETKANILFRLGKLLYDRGRYQEAKTELEKGRSFTSSNQTYFDNYIQFAERSIYHAQLYREANRDIADGNLQSARDKLAVIANERSDFIDVAKKLASLDSLIVIKQDEKALSELYDRALEYEAKEDYSKAITAYRQILLQDSSHIQAKQRLQNTTERLEVLKLERSIEEEYAEGLNAFQNSNWIRASLAFEKVQELRPDFRDTRVLLDEVKRKLKLQSEESATARYYFDGLAAMNKEDFDEALFAFEQVVSLDPNYKNVSSLVESIEQSLQRKYQSAMIDPAADYAIDSLYQRSITEIESENWAKVIAILERILRQQPDYRDAASLLSFARANLEQGKSVEYGAPSNRTSRSTTMLFGGVIAAMIVLPLAGYFVFSPSARARVMLMRGKYGQATQIYERLLAKNPGRLKLYVPLANLYLLTGRKDELALRVFRMILQLNLAKDRQEEISAIVAQNYLQDGKQNAESIKALESALDWQYRLRASHQNDEVS